MDYNCELRTLRLLSSNKQRLQKHAHDLSYRFTRLPQVRTAGHRLLSSLKSEERYFLYNKYTTIPKTVPFLEIHAVYIFQSSKQSSPPQTVFLPRLANKALSWCLGAQHNYELKQTILLVGALCVHVPLLSQSLASSRHKLDNNKSNFTRLC